MGTEQLVGTIKKVETHDSDPTTSKPADPWDTVSAEFGELLNSLQEAYRATSNGKGPSEAEIRDAVSTLLGAWDNISEAVTAALAQPAVRNHLKGTAASLATALSATIAELGKELRSGSAEEE